MIKATNAQTIPNGDKLTNAEIFPMKSSETKITRMFLLLQKFEVTVTY